MLHSPEHDDFTCHWNRYEDALTVTHAESIVERRLLQVGLEAGILQSLLQVRQNLLLNVDAELDDFLVSFGLSA